MALHDTWRCPACNRDVHTDNSGALREHTILRGADRVWRCKGSGFNIFLDRRSQLVQLGIAKPAAQGGAEEKRD